MAVSVYAGNTGDPTTVADQIEKLRERFGLSRAVMVGDRGMLTQPQIEKLKQHPGLGWITALTSTAIRELVKQGALQLSLMDQKNLAEITAPDYPGERLMVCHNPVLEEERKRKREALLAATEKSLEKIGQEVARRKKKALTAAEIGLKVGKGWDATKWASTLTAKSARAASFGAVVQSRSSRKRSWTEFMCCAPASQWSGFRRKIRCAATRAWRKWNGLLGLKGIDLLVRPIRHRSEDRVPAHFFYACWPTMWNGICAGLGRRCYSKMKSGGRSASAAIRFFRGSPRIPCSARSARIKLRRVSPCTASRA